MPDEFFRLNQQDQREALEYGSAHSGRPAHLLEKDVWVVWVLRALFESPLKSDLTFKGGTSLSKVYKVIDRFSEDIDLTYDIRKLIPDLAGEQGELPGSRAQADKWTKEVRHRLPDWIAQQVQPILQTALAQVNLKAELEISGTEKDKLLLRYEALTQGTGYVAPVVTLEFGARSTGEPHQVSIVTCDIAEHLPDVSFPIAAPLVMSISRTFWEKATAAHVFCAQGRIRGERYARHWHDLAAIARSSQHWNAVMADQKTALTVAQHKSRFFIEKDAQGQVINYLAAVNGGLNIVPQGKARDALAEDYAAMLHDNVMVGNALPFDELILVCTTLEAGLNKKSFNHIPSPE